MAVSRTPVTISIPASGDLSGSQFRIVYPDATGAAAVATGSANPVIGVLANKPGAAGRPAEVVVHGVAKLEAGAAINPGDAVQAVAGGRGSATTTAGNWYVGVALTAAAGSGALFEVLVNPARY